MQIPCCAAILRRYGRVSAAVALAAVAVPATVSAADLPQSWLDMRWDSVHAPAIVLSANVSSVWDSYLTTAVSQWNAADRVGYNLIDGTNNPAACSPSYWTVQVCSANYGKTGWLGYTTAYTSFSDYTTLIGVTVRLNEYYYSQAKYNTAAWRAETVCQELGNALGLDDSDRNTRNANTGSCMDYTSNPAGGGKVLANTSPNASDLTNLNAIYAAHVAVQPRGFRVDGGEATIAAFGSANLAVPEPATWAMLVIGFGAVGAALRRRGTSVAA